MTDRNNVNGEGGLVMLLSRCSYTVFNVVSKEPCGELKRPVTGKKTQHIIIYYGIKPTNQKNNP